MLTLLFTLGLAVLSTTFAIPVSEFDANVSKGLRLIQTSDNAAPLWVTENQKLDLVRKNEGFFDLTETYYKGEEQKEQNVEAVVESTDYPAPSKSSTVRAIMSTLSVDRMRDNLDILTGYHNRYYKSETGVAASNWIYNQLRSIADGKSNVDVLQFNHSWAQKSVIARFNGASATGAVILGCHLDSINQIAVTGRAPGADDNGTGTANLMEVFRALVDAGFSPDRPVEFHFYAGEEGGLLGSQDISSNYKDTGKVVYAMMNLDMTGYFKPGSKEVIALVTDNVDPYLSNYLRSLVSAYSTLPIGEYTCGYACSDHASWNKQGYPAAFPFEAPKGLDNQFIHTALDTTEKISWEHLLEFAKLAVAFAAELGLHRRAQ